MRVAAASTSPTATHGAITGASAAFAVNSAGVTLAYDRTCPATKPFTAVATLDDDILEVHFNQGGPRDLQQHIAAGIAHDYSTRSPQDPHGR